MITAADLNVWPETIDRCMGISIEIKRARDRSAE